MYIIVGNHFLPIHSTYITIMTQKCIDDFLFVFKIFYNNAHFYVFILTLIMHISGENLHGIGAYMFYDR